MEEKVSKREEAEAAVEKARIRLDKARALLAEARALVTVYVVRLYTGDFGREIKYKRSPAVSSAPRLTSPQKQPNRGSGVLILWNRKPTTHKAYAAFFLFKLNVCLLALTRSDRFALEVHALLGLCGVDSPVMCLW